jgi:hypothetical protein
MKKIGYSIITITVFCCANILNESFNDKLKIEYIDMTQHTIYITPNR